MGGGKCKAGFVQSCLLSQALDTKHVLLMLFIASLTDSCRVPQTGPMVQGTVSDGASWRCLWITGTVRFNRLDAFK
jgi:hypothetical protein